MADVYAHSFASLDGEIMPAVDTVIPATDDGLLRGDGVFDAFRVYDGRPFRLEEHLARLERSASNIRLAADLEAVRSDVHRLLATVGGAPGHEVVRIILTRGGRRLILTEPLPELPDRVRLGSVIFSPSRVLDGVKSLSYGANMLARRLAVEQGFHEALLVTPHGRVLEGPTSSVFWVKQGQVLTPPLSDHILASITRRLVIEVAGAQERESSLEDLLGADEVFLASTVREVQPVAGLDDREYPPEAPVTGRVAGAVAERLAAELAGG